MKACPVMVLAFFALPVWAQQPDTARTVPIVRPADVVIIGSFVAGSLVMGHFDSRISAWARQPGFQNNGALRSGARGAALFGDPGSVIIDAALYAGGRIAHNKNVQTDGESALEAAALSGLVTYVLKGAFGRARPYADSTNATDFRFARGFPNAGEFQSFPSGHTTAGFAFASVITARLARRSPRTARWAGPLLYTAAALTGLSRVYDHKHWASDVLTGAAIGTVSGLIVVRWHDRHP